MIIQALKKNTTPLTYPSIKKNENKFPLLMGRKRGGKNSFISTARTGGKKGIDVEKAGD